MSNSRSVREPVSGKVAKVPVVMQLEALECGAASLTMIMEYYGKWIPLEQVRSDCGVSRDGASAANIVKAARNYGMSAKAYKVEPEELKAYGEFPCIVHWEFNHFIVVCGFRGNKVIVNDPAKGKMTISMEEFDAGFTGVVLIISPAENFEPSGHKKSMLEFARKRLRGTGAAVAFVILTSAILALVGVFNPIMSRIFIDRLLNGKNMGWYYVLFGSLFVLALVQLTVSWINSIYSLKLNGKLAVVGNASFMWKVLRLPMDFFSQRMVGDIMMRQESNGTVAASLINTFAPLTVKSVLLVFYLTAMIIYSPLLATIGVVSVILDYFMSRIISEARVNSLNVQMINAGKQHGAMTAGIRAIETIKASGAENSFFEKWSGYQAAVGRHRASYIRKDAYLTCIPSVINMLADAIILAIGIMLVMQGKFTVGMIMAFQGLMSSFTSPASEFISAGQMLMEMRTDMERIEDVMEYPIDPVLREHEIPDEMLNDGEGDAKHRVPYTKLAGRIEFKHVSFAYSPLSQPVVKDFNLTIEPGERVAFVGKSGCGKSTLARLMSGLRVPTEGEILYDGKSIFEIDRNVFTGSLAVVSQDIILFEDSIKNNIKIWDNSIEDFEVILAARDAQIHQDIMARSGGYSYVLTENGNDFSGGQRQRLEIARVLAQDPSIIVLDEATSALDAKTEFDTVQAIKDRGITCVVVAHRLSTIRDCDKILVLDNGVVAEMGTHDELMKLGGMYCELVTDD